MLLEVNTPQRRKKGVMLFAGTAVSEQPHRISQGGETRSTEGVMHRRRNPVCCGAHAFCAAVQILLYLRKALLPFFCAEVATSPLVHSPLVNRHLEPIQA